MRTAAGHRARHAILHANLERAVAALLPTMSGPPVGADAGSLATIELLMTWSCCSGHPERHRQLVEEAADFCACTGRMWCGVPLAALVEWSFRQTEAPEEAFGPAYRKRLMQDRRP